MTRGDLTDGERELVEPHLPMGAFGPIPDLRRNFNAVMWRFRTGSPWRDVPQSYGSWSTIYDRFRMWARGGIFRTHMEAMIAEAAARDDVDLSLVSGQNDPVGEGATVKEDPEREQPCVPSCRRPRRVVSFP